MPVQLIGDGRPSRARWAWGAGLLAWAAFCAWLVWGYPPCVDLPAHAAQLETLDALLRGDTAVGAVYAWHFPMGYGLVYWLGLPLAHLWNGAVAARVLLWSALLLHPIAWAALLRALGRSLGVLPCLLPVAFCISYWYGFLPFYCAEPLLFLGLALFLGTLERPTGARIAAVNALGCLLALCHLLLFAVFLTLAGCTALARTDWRRVARLIAAAFAAPLLVCAPRVWTLLNRAVSPGPLLATDYDAMSHLNWFFKNYRSEGRLVAVYPLALTALFAICWVRRRRLEPPAPLAMFAGMAVLYLVTPKTLSGVALVSVRFACLAATFGAMLVDWRTFPRALRSLLLALSLLSLGETAVFHWRFARAVDGLDAMIAIASGNSNGYLSTAGNRILGTKHIYLEHMGAWVTATRGGVGQNFFADADQQPVVQRTPGVPPADLSQANRAQLERFETLLIFGPRPFPESLSGWPVLGAAAAWTTLGRP